MISATAFLSYVWHYLVARMVYDQLLRPLIHGRVTAALAMCCAAGAGFALGRLSRRRA
jgi:hypothetical protein